LNPSGNSDSNLNQHVIDWLVEKDQPPVRYYTLQVMRAPKANHASQAST
jgi:hypothetical protein